MHWVSLLLFDPFQQVRHFIYFATGPRSNSIWKSSCTSTSFQSLSGLWRASTWIWGWQASPIHLFTLLFSSWVWERRNASSARVSSLKTITKLLRLARSSPFLPDLRDSLRFSARMVEVSSVSRACQSWSNGFPTQFSSGRTSRPTWARAMTFRRCTRSRGRSRLARRSFLLGRSAAAPPTEMLQNFFGVWTRMEKTFTCRQNWRESLVPLQKKTTSRGFTVPKTSSIRDFHSWQDLCTAILLKVWKVLSSSQQRWGCLRA